MSIKLVRDHISRDLEEAAQLLAEGIRTGQLNGLVFAASLKGTRRYFVDVAGVLARDPTLCRGIVAAIDDELQRLVQAQAMENTTL